MQINDSDDLGTHMRRRPTCRCLFAVMNGKVGFCELIDANTVKINGTRMTVDALLAMANVFTTEPEALARIPGALKVRPSARIRN